MGHFKKYPVPRLAGNYVTVYRPQGDFYLGTDSEHFQKGSYYPDWIVNDFTVVKAQDAWHLIGITHPKPPGFVDAYQFAEGADVHEAEWQLFHARTAGGSIREAITENAFSDQPKLLYPQERPGEAPEIWAPHCVPFNGKYYMIYSPDKMRLAVSEDLYHWELKGTLFQAGASARDPNIRLEEDRQILTYIGGDNNLYYRISADMLNWSEPRLLQSAYYRNASSESPFLIRREGVYYLFWAIYDGRNGSYDQRTFVFASETLEGFEQTAPITILNAHAPEIIEEAGAYYIASVYYPENGVSIAPLAWE